MTAQVSNPAAQVAKAATDQSAALVEAVGLPHAWQAISAAAEDKIPATSKGPLLQSIAADQLSRAAGTVKTDGLTPQVLDLLQMLLDLMRGQAQPGMPSEPGAERATPSRGGIPEEQLRARAQAAMAAKAQGASDNELREAIQGALAEMFPAEDDEPMTRVWVVDIFPADSTVVFERQHNIFQVAYTFDAATGTASLTGQPTEVRRTYVPVGAEAAPEITAAAKAGVLKGLPAPQTDSLRFRQEQREPPPLGAPQRKQDDGAAEKGLPPPKQVEGGVLSSTEQDTAFGREADAFKADARRKGLPAPQTDSLRFRQEQREPPPLGAPMRKAKSLALVLGRQDDIAPQEGPKAKTYHYGTAG